MMFNITIQSLVTAMVRTMALPSMVIRLFSQSQVTCALHNHGWLNNIDIMKKKMFYNWLYNSIFEL
jgi:hypothetical protein